MYEHRIKTLEQAHQLLDKRIDGMEKTGVFGDQNLNDMKKQRLILRDELAKLKRIQWEHDHETIEWEED